MTRLLVIATLVVTAALSVGSGVVYARPGVSAGLLGVPASLQAGTTSAVAVRLPAQVAAADGRIMFDTSAAEVVGVAADGKGTAMAPEDIPGGVAFGAYGLQARGGQTIINVVFFAHRDGRLPFRIVIDSAADASGRRVAVPASTALGTLSIGVGTASFQQPSEATRLAPAHAVGTLRDVVSDGVVGKTDLDVLRANWERTRGNGSSCGTTSTADANGDGCVDIVDLQAMTARQGQAAPVQADGSPFAAPSAVAPNAPTFTVITTNDTPDAHLGDGLCADSQGRCSLRAAISESNWMKGDNRINFSLSGNAPVRIQLVGGDLPIIQDRSGGVYIDGYSQPGSSVNTLSFGSNAVPGVEIRGNTGSSRGNAFRMTSANNTIRGFLLTAHYRSIFMDGPDAHHNEILGNLIGFTRTGTVDSYRGNHGVRMNVGATYNHVGGPALADRNVIGNFTHAVDFYGPGTDSNTVQNNVLCMTPNGRGAATCATGIDHNFGPKNNLEGGYEPSERNVIGPTTLNGIEISHGWDPDTRESNTTWQLQYNRIIGNWIGFRGDGSYDANFRSGQNAPNSNDANGVNVYDGSSFNLVEGNTIGARWDGINTMSPTATGNVIKNNLIGESPLGQPAPLGRYGIQVRVSTKSHVIEGNIIRNAAVYGIALTQKNVLWIRISRNIITDMSGPAIYLAPDSNDPSKGANNLLKAPVITTATTAHAAGTGIAGATVELYRGTRPAGQSGLPDKYLGSTVVAANGTWTMPIVVATGERVVGLQINPANNTSALGTNVTATFEAPPQKPVANFSSSQRAGTLTVDFTDVSTNSPAQWAWNFGDGTSSTLQSPNHAYALAGNYTVALTATNGGGTDTMSKLITVQPLPAGTTYAADGFGRTMSGWGNADVGGAYLLQGDAANYAVGNGVGTMLFSTANSSRAALLNGVSQLDVDVQFRVSTNKVAAGGNYTVYAATRRIGTNEYRPRIIFNANGTVSVNASVVNNNVESALGAPVVVPGVIQGANSFIWFRAQVTGASPTTIRVKAWADGQTEPVAWQFTAADSLAAIQVAGSIGLRAYVGNVTTAPIVLSFDDYSVRSPS
jgi:hypothetical protein